MLCFRAQVYNNSNSCLREPPFSQTQEPKSSIQKSRDYSTVSMKNSNAVPVTGGVHGHGKEPLKLAESFSLLSFTDPTAHLPMFYKWQKLF